MEPNEMPSDDEFRAWLRPRMVLQGSLEYFFTWIFTRQWWSAIFFCAPFGLFAVASLALVTYGSWLDRATLVERYGEWVDEELPDVMQHLSEDATQNDDEDSQETSREDGDLSDSQDVAEEEVTAYGEMLLRRLLQLEDSNSRATYMVAAQLSRTGRNGQTRQMMRRIAPEGGGGFVPAHTWLATDQLVRQRISGVDSDRLAADLSMAAGWIHTNPKLLGVYADLLVSQNKIDEALKILGQASQRDSSMRIKLANLAARYGRKQRLDRVSTEAKAEIRKRMEADTATAEDLEHLANLFLLEQNPDGALHAVRLGFKKNPDSPGLKRLASEAYRMQYIMTAVLSGDEAKVNLSLLDAALKSDPTNPGVGDEIAKLLAAGREPSPSLQRALEQQLANGHATALAHILLAERSLSDENLTDAIPHLELALRQAPNNPSVMNNLALALARSDPESLERPLILSTGAVRVNPGSAQYLDTLGEILAMSGDQFGAVNAYETAIRLDGSRIDTRTRLVQLYHDLKMISMAERQEQEISKLQAAPKKE